jgi:hypothetical protein
VIAAVVVTVLSVLAIGVHEGSKLLVDIQLAPGVDGESGHTVSDLLYSSKVPRHSGLDRTRMSNDYTSYLPRNVLAVQYAVVNIEWYTEDNGYREVMAGWGKGLVFVPAGSTKAS